MNTSDLIKAEQDLHRAIALLEESAVIVEVTKGLTPGCEGELAAAHEQVELAVNQLLETIKRVKGFYRA